MSPAPFGLWSVAAKTISVAIGVALVIGLMMLAGCGSSALDSSTTTLGSFRAAQTGVVKTLEVGLEADLESHCGELATIERETCARERAEEWRMVESGMNAAAATLDELAGALLVWAERVEATEASADMPPVSVCDALSSLTSVAVAWARFGGVSLPVEPWTCGGSAP